MLNLLSLKHKDKRIDLQSNVNNLCEIGQIKINPPTNN